ncbi:hypothetical protein Tco_1201557 [Tanacetum coccineum]
MCFGNAEYSDPDRDPERSESRSYPYGHKKLAVCEDIDQVRGVMEKYPPYQPILGKLSYGKSQMLNKTFYEEEVKRLCLSFEKQEEIVDEADVYDFVGRTLGLVEFASMDQVESVKTSKALKEIFLEFKDVSHDFILDERCVWIDLVGLSLASWAPEESLLHVIAPNIEIDGGQFLKSNPLERKDAEGPYRRMFVGCESDLVESFEEGEGVSWMIQVLYNDGCIRIAWKRIWETMLVRFFGVDSQGCDCGNVTTVDTLRCSLRFD